MTVVILKRGKELKVKCKECKSKLKYEKGDIKSKTLIGNTFSFIECPVCKYDVFIK